MPEITDSDLGDDYWCTTDDVREEFQLEIQNQEPDFDKRIGQASRRVQAWWADATGKAVPDDLPTDIPELLQDATAYMAASLAHQAFAQNISGDNDDDQRHVFLEDSARDTFEDWKITADLDPGAEQDESASDTVTGQIGTIRGDNPIYRGDD